MAPKRRKIPAEPSGRIGPKRPDNKPRRKSSRDVNEIGKGSEPDARFDDERRPESDAREVPGGAPHRKEHYKNTDEGI
jgi:hypothetical protein